ncbi:NAD-dependent epimerase/dehydratase family protein [Patescibacteria group bacterium]|nr:NAD-dependent epimerase/dehydratase family protein [Patescibacteria group bacterium]MCL5409265.1 NAD-dependent epimerase/dehydratase family protein [Patescibacteria group bacterium]
MEDQLSNFILKDAQIILKKVNLNPLANKTILVTGASGLIGSYLLASLKLLQQKKIKFRLAAVIQSPPHKYLLNLIDYSGAKFYRGDLTNESFNQHLPRADYIIHAAGFGQPGRFMEYPLKTIYLNTATTFTLLNKLKKGGKLLFISTSEVYSGLSQPPYKESQIGVTNTNHPRSCYIEGKRTGEAICFAARQAGVDVKVTRLSLAYGPGTKVHDQRVLNSFIEKALNGKVELLDAGLAKRTYCYVTDAVELLWQVLLYGQEPLYNVGGKSRVTIGRLAKLIGTYLKVPVIFPQTQQTLKGAPADVYLDMTKSRKEFGKTDFVQLKEGLHKTIDWQKLLYQNS